MLSLVRAGYVHHTVDPLFPCNGRFFRIPTARRNLDFFFDTSPDEDTPPHLNPKDWHNYYDGGDPEN